LPLAVPSIGSVVVILTLNVFFMWCFLFVVFVSVGRRSRIRIPVARGAKTVLI